MWSAWARYVGTRTHTRAHTAHMKGERERESERGRESERERGEMFWVLWKLSVYLVGREPG